MSEPRRVGIGLAQRILDREAGFLEGPASGSAPLLADPPITEGHSLDSSFAEIFGKLTDLDAGTFQVTEGLRERLEAVEARLAQGPDAYTARSLLEMNDRVARIEKHVVMLASQQVMQEKQMTLHIRATALDMAIKACKDAALSGNDITSTADAFVMWLGAGVMSQ